MMTYQVVENGVPSPDVESRVVLADTTTISRQAYDGISWALRQHVPPQNNVHAELPEVVCVIL